MVVDVDIKVIHERVKLESAFVESLKREVQKVIVGQDYMIDRILIGILSQGHILLEGVPGLAKTLTVKTFAKAIETGFQRIQFTPDLLPADLIGTMIFDQKSGDFIPHKGPIFSNIILADEIFRERKFIGLHAILRVIFYLLHVFHHRTVGRIALDAP